MMSFDGEDEVRLKVCKASRNQFVGNSTVPQFDTDECGLSLSIVFNQKLIHVIHATYRDDPCSSILTESILFQFFIVNQTSDLTKNCAI